MEYRFVIFGKIIHTDYFVNLLNKYDFPKPLVIISLDEEYHRDNRLLAPFGLNSNIEELSNNGLCYLYKMKTVNCEAAIALFDEYKVNIGISINCRNIIKRMVIDYFDQPILNLHDSYLPDERGGALNSWRILNGISEVGNTLHYLEEGIDTGAIVLQKKTLINKERPQPIDYLQAETMNCKKIFESYIDSLRLSKPIAAVKQENDKSFYYPRLFTEINGAINWDWDIDNIEKFIRAFSVPYPGAYTYYRGEKINILSCCVEASEYSFHPFANGKIVTILDNKKVRVIAGGKPLLIESLLINGEIVNPGDFLEVKFSLYSPEEELFHAKNHVPTTLSMNKSEIKYQESLPSREK